VSQHDALALLASPARSMMEPPLKGVTPHLDANLGMGKARDSAAGQCS
jgi:hypothetical protein